MSANRLDQLIDAWDARLQRAFMDSVAAVRDAAQLARIVEALERGDVDGALLAVGLDPVQFRALDKALAEAFEDGGNFAMRGIPALRQAGGLLLNIAFNVRNARAEQWLRDHAGELISEIVADQRVAIRNFLTAGMAAGNNPRAVALDLVGRINRATKRREGGVIGLTASQEEWVRNYAAELASDNPLGALSRALRDKRFDPTVRRIAESGERLSAPQIDAMVTAYKNRALRYRAEAIGRTEAMTSLHQAQNEAVQQAIDAGQVDESDVTKKWHSAGDARVRDTHRALNGKSVSFRAAFVSPSGARIRFPGDPDAPAAETIQCRCWMETRFAHLAGLR